MARDNYQRGKKGGHRPDRRISVRSVRRENPDFRKLAQALIALAQAQAEVEAQSQGVQSSTKVDGVPGSKEAA